MTDLVIESCAYLRDAAVVRPRCAICPLHQQKPGADLGIKSNDRVQVMYCRFDKALHVDVCGPACDQGSGLGRVQQPIFFEGVGVAVTGSFAAQHAHATACTMSLTRRLDDALINADGTGCDRLKVKLGEVSACGQCGGEQTLDQRRVHCEAVLEYGLQTGVGQRYRATHSL